MCTKSMAKQNFHFLAQLKHNTKFSETEKAICLILRDLGLNLVSFFTHPVVYMLQYVCLFSCIRHVVFWEVIRWRCENSQRSQKRPTPTPQKETIQTGFGGTIWYVTVVSSCRFIASNFVFSISLYNFVVVSRNVLSVQTGTPVWHTQILLI